ncbi:MAG: hypothetical protein A3H49_09205 [Nitrospirae bacterium RIFCSPLOWO2_02_FULL_62_14]|nr:MAG: hypothetical protein A3H49_09205 [Nitrospirae bacterium RIFCSPLOWO2_02_FULL_62_14]
MAGVQGEPAIARDNAIQDALRKAVEQAVGTMVSSETLVENFQVVRDNIYNKSQGYVKEYKVVKESPGKDLYAVTISATVSTENLKNDLGALGLLIARVGKPRTLFMIAEQNVGQEILLYWWGYWGKGGAAFAGQSVEMAVSETVLKEEFLNRGFNVIDISAVTGKFEISNAYRIADLTDTGARDIGRKMGAEIIIKGKALAKEGPRTAGSSVGSYLADITLSAVRVDNGQVLASVRGNAAARHIAQHVGGNQAIENAARQVADKLVEQITAKWTAEMSGGQLIQLTIRGLSGMKDLIKIKEFLKGKVRGVQNVIQRSFERGEAVLEVDAKSSAQQLGDELASKPIQGLDLDIIAATGNTLELCVAGKCAEAAASAPTASSMPASPEEGMGGAKTYGVLKSMRSARDKDVVVQLNEVKVRGSVLQVVVSGVYQGKVEAAAGTKQSGHFAVSSGSVLDYNTNKKYESTGVDGDTCCSVGPGDIKRVQITFPAPPGAKKVGISIGGLGTFDEVMITQ